MGGSQVDGRMELHRSSILHPGHFSPFQPSPLPPPPSSSSCISTLVAVAAVSLDRVAAYVLFLSREGGRGFPNSILNLNHGLPPSVPAIFVTTPGAGGALTRPVQPL